MGAVLAAVVARVLAAVQVEQATEAEVVTGLVMVQGQSVMVRVVAWGMNVSTCISSREKKAWLE